MPWSTKGRNMLREIACLQKCFHAVKFFLTVFCVIPPLPIEVNCPLRNGEISRTENSSFMLKSEVHKLLNRYEKSFNFYLSPSYIHCNSTVELHECHELYKVQTPYSNKNALLFYRITWVEVICFLLHSLHVKLQRCTSNAFDYSILVVYLQIVNCKWTIATTIWVFFGIPSYLSPEFAHISHFPCFSI